MTKRYKLSISSSIILHAILIAVFFRIKIPVMKYSEKTQFNIVFSDADVVIKSTSPAILSADSGSSMNEKFIKQEGEYTIGRLNIPSLTNRKINKTLLSSSDKSMEIGTPEKISTNIKKVSPDRNVFIPEPTVQDILKEVGGISNSADSLSDLKTLENHDNSIKWNHKSRRILRSEPISFPDVLKLEGQDATVKAKIFVSPEGNVRKVEIIKGSGYIEVDSAVTASLRQYLFNPSEKGEEDIGIIEIHFKLKRED